MHVQIKLLFCRSRLPLLFQQKLPIYICEHSLLFCSSQVDSVGCSTGALAVAQQNHPIIANYRLSKIFVIMAFHVNQDLLPSSAHSWLIGTYIWIGEGNCDLGVVHVIGNVP